VFLVFVSVYFLF